MNAIMIEWDNDCKALRAKNGPLMINAEEIVLIAGNGILVQLLLFGMPKSYICISPWFKDRERSTQYYYRFL